MSYCETTWLLSDINPPLESGFAYTRSALRKPIDEKPAGADPTSSQETDGWPASVTVVAIDSARLAVPIARVRRRSMWCSSSAMHNVLQEGTTSERRGWFHASHRDPRCLPGQADSRPTGTGSEAPSGSSVCTTVIPPP